jgi:hypothetical protein
VGALVLFPTLGLRVAEAAYPERYITIICASTKMRIEVRRGARHFVGAGGTAFLAPRAGRGPDAQEENQNSAR